MLYLYYGSGENAARTKVRATTDALLKKQPEALLIRVTTESITSQNFSELFYSQGLFKNNYIIVLDRVLFTPEGEGFLDSIKDIATSEHVVFVLEGALTKAQLAKLEKHSEKTHEFTSEKKASATHNSFAITDALMTRNKKDAWVELQRAFMEGKSAEELHGLMFWALKTILIAERSNSAQEAAMKEYPFKKAKSALTKWSDSDVLSASTAFATLPLIARTTGPSLDILLEKFVLEL